MSALVGESISSMDSLSEVEKLQDLVKKLELQNEVLRSKQTEKAKQSQQDLNHRKGSATEEASLDEVDLLDLERSFSEEEEDSWLFKGPTHPSPEQKSVSPVKWAREDLEKPSPEMKSVRRSLLYKLDEATRVIRSPSAGSLGHPDAMLPSVIEYNEKEFSPLRDPTVSDEPSDPEIQEDAQPPVVVPAPTRSLGYGSNSAINTNTFVRKKKPSRAPQSDANEAPSFVAKFSQRNSPGSSNRSSPRTSPPQGDWQPREGQPGIPEGGLAVEQLEPVLPSAHLSNVLDIHNMAKLQEESLRQSMSSPYMMKRNAQRSNNSLDSLGSSESSGAPGSPYGSSQCLNNSANGRVQQSSGNIKKHLTPHITHHFLPQVKLTVEVSLILLAQGSHCAPIPATPVFHLRPHPGAQRNASLGPLGVERGKHRPDEPFLRHARALCHALAVFLARDLHLNYQHPESQVFLQCEDLSLHLDRWMTAGKMDVFDVKKCTSIKTLEIAFKASIETHKDLKPTVKHMVM
ncbi:hypothetical protein CAPTEDRAFT_201562 [Capitella teleta]|uniref:Uncharacterized protein n=1 Tax=Capitella teleta TaxID=283909 RepID=R7U9C3_CAPTE|nr:hypothetical protein CAPTEDRAFT_201562 [Capitella teleta]|eukprot:ELU02746.1 hypothetical protein CAPTEDRAFT_201562 [Capitella teleta]